MKWLPFGNFQNVMNYINFCTNAMLNFVSPSQSLSYLSRSIRFVSASIQKYSGALDWCNCFFILCFTLESNIIINDVAARCVLVRCARTRKYILFGVALLIAIVLNVQPIEWIKQNNNNNKNYKKNRRLDTRQNEKNKIRKKRSHKLPALKSFLQRAKHTHTIYH